MHYQFDIVQQKQNLGNHHQVHPAMYMPSHAEFLIESLSRLGFKPGLSFGLDDFAVHSSILNQSQAEVLIVCGADQHYREEFAIAWKGVQRLYSVKVLVVSEPIFSDLAYWQSSQQNALLQHQQFLEMFQPDIVLYLSRYDCLQAQQAYPETLSLLYSLADPEFLSQPRLPWEQKQQAALWLGKPVAWMINRSPAQWSRQQQVDFFVQQQDLPFRAYSHQLTFRECYLMANQYAFQIQPRSGYTFHTARTVQSAIVGAIPVLLLHPQEQELLAIEAPFVRPDHNCLVGWESDYQSVIKKMLDPDLTAEIQSHLSELLQAGTIGSGVYDLGCALQTHLKA